MMCPCVVVDTGVAQCGRSLEMPCEEKIADNGIDDAIVVKLVDRLAHV